MIVRLQARRSRVPLSHQHPPVSLVLPVCGIDNYAADTLRSSLELGYPNYELLLCVASAADPVLPLVRGLIGEYPDARVKLLIGRQRVSDNPKLNNVVKGWRASSHQFVIIADSNVLMPRNYIQQLLARWQPDTGLVAAPPVGSLPQGFWAEVECAFLNAYQARWLYVTDSFGRAFAHGKTMLCRRGDIERAGGFEKLNIEVAEDAAATKIVRTAGLRVRLIDRPVEQPLGNRSATEVWSRQLRWARLRRSAFFMTFLLEIVAGAALPMIAMTIIAKSFDLPIALTLITFGGLWYGAEMLLAAVAGWRLSLLYPLYGITRDLLLPVLFVSALCGRRIVWRGNEMRI